MAENKDDLNLPIYNLVATDPSLSSGVTRQPTYTEVQGTDPNDYFTINQYNGKIVQPLSKYIF